MATTAYAVPGTETPAADAMDLHSDNLDFGDVDIDIDLDPAPSADGHEDDISIKDATADNEADAESVNADQDDYMVDHEYAEEQDELHYVDDVDAYKNASHDNPTPQPQGLFQAEDDLLEYSDEEEPSPTDDQGVSVEEQYHETNSTEYVDIGSGGVNSTDKSAVDDYAAKNDDETYNPDVQDEYQNERVDGEAKPAEGEDTAEHASGSQSHAEDDEHTDDNDGGVGLDTHESYEDVEQHDSYSDEEEEFFTFDPRPITINHNGNEYWLFKDYDTDNSGDWLLEDAKEGIYLSLGELLSACRRGLDNEVPDEQELGIRFDHLFNLEVYEDDTACVTLSLQIMLKLYHDLHHQDGIDEPESFYVTLVSRPRITTLLADLFHYAKQNRGYMALSAAVAAGETNFPVALSETTPENAEWETDGNAEVDQQESNSDSEHDGARATAQDQHLSDTIGEKEIAELVEEEGHEDETAYADASHTSQAEVENNEPAEEDHINNSDYAAQAAETNTADFTEHPQPAESTPVVQEFEHDYIEYDDEDEATLQDTNTNPTQRSPSSSTLNADETATGDYTRSVTQTQEHHEDTSYDINALADQEHQNNDLHQPITAESENVDVTAAPENHSWHDEVSHEETLILDPQGSDDKHTPQLDPTSDAAEGVRDFLDDSLDDLENQLNDTEPYFGLDPSLYEINLDNSTKDPDDTFSVHGEGNDLVKDQDGVAVEHSEVAVALSDANLEPSSSNDLLNNSTQGLKRTIEQVGDSSDDTAGSADIKRPRM